MTVTVICPFDSPFSDIFSSTLAVRSVQATRHPWELRPGKLHVTSDSNLFQLLKNIEFLQNNRFKEKYIVVTQSTQSGKKILC